MAHPQEDMASKYGRVRPFLLTNVLILDSQDAPNLVENGMRKPLSNLADLPPDVQAHIAAQTAELIAERTAHSQAIQNRDTIIADLRMQLDGHKNHRFGSRSESLDQLALELVLEEHEIGQAGDDAPAAEREVKSQRTPRRAQTLPQGPQAGRKADHAQ